MRECKIERDHRLISSVRTSKCQSALFGPRNMRRLTVDLVRKRAEHNDGELSNLEEISLHQMDIEKIEYLHRWCPHLRILLMQGNLISKIENVRRLRELEYLNLALNNIEAVEGLEQCEALTKLDLTANFITDILSVTTLQDLPNLRELYLMGNPCSSYRGYRSWVICHLPTLEELDGTQVTRSSRISALHDLTQAEVTVREDQQQAMEKRAKERKKYEEEERGREEVDIEDMNDDQWWNSPTEHSPEARLTLHRELEKKRERENANNSKNNNNNKQSRSPRLFTSDGRPLNVNAAKVEFHFAENETDNCFVLEVDTYKYMDTSLVECEVEPWYVRVTVKGKVLQLVLLEEVRPGQATAIRSSITGHLVVTMPKLAAPTKGFTALEKIPTVTPVTCTSTTVSSTTQKTADEHNEPKSSFSVCDSGSQEKYLEIGDGDWLDYKNIVKNGPRACLRRAPPPNTSGGNSRLPPLRPNSPDFVDNPDVPPLQ